MTTRNASAVSNVAWRLSGAQQRLGTTYEGKPALSSIKASQARLRGDMEHISHESAVNRYMQADARRTHRHTNAIFGFLAATVFGVIGAVYLFVLS
ncbi:hypothetical protein GWQ43_20070 (plasmid) [Alcaligenes faecalis]|uniref:hypothetical protein n=1 Tax=Alcaligenes faecalis TaxID=511 RepID=UPI000F68778E|nr:hypothetical protein [Alcaligenes faecalis]QHS38461.1 hypothetical protein GWQ43_20070 [Alcaligenes faecalis]